LIDGKDSLGLCAFGGFAFLLFRLETRSFFSCSLCRGELFTHVVLCAPVSFDVSRVALAKACGLFFGKPFGFNACGFFSSELGRF
jgi:hypothetical protein